MSLSTGSKLLIGAAAVSLGVFGIAWAMSSPAMTPVRVILAPGEQDTANPVAVRIGQSLILSTPDGSPITFIQDNPSFKLPSLPPGASSVTLTAIAAGPAAGETALTIQWGAQGQVNTSVLAVDVYTVVDR